MVDDLWRKIAAWLADNAPGSAALLLPPDLEQPILDASELVGRWFEVQGGARGDNRVRVLFDYVPMSAQESLEERDFLAGLMPTWLADWDILDPDVEHPFLPIANSTAGQFLVVDARPGPEYRSVKELDFEDPTTLDEPLWTDLEHLLREVQRCLADGTPGGPFGLVPTVVGGYVDWLGPTWTSQRTVVHAPAPSPPVPGSPWTWARLSAQVDARPGQDDEQRLAIIGAALDRLLAMEPAELALATRAEPREVFSVDFNVLLAACVEYAHTVVGTPPPDWVRGRYRFMKPAWKLVNFPSSHVAQLTSTPPAFTEHGITFVK